MYIALQIPTFRSLAAGRSITESSSSLAGPLSGSAAALKVRTVLTRGLTWPDMAAISGSSSSGANPFGGAPVDNHHHHVVQMWQHATFVSRVVILTNDCPLARLRTVVLFNSLRNGKVFKIRVEFHKYVINNYNISPGWKMFKEMVHLT